MPSLWFYKYLAGRLECLDREMENAALDLVNLLIVRPVGFASAARGNFVNESPIFRDEIGIRRPHSLHARYPHFHHFLVRGLSSVGQTLASHAWWIGRFGFVVMPGLDSGGTVLPRASLVTHLLPLPSLCPSKCT